MPKTPGKTISDAQLGRALRRYLADAQDCEVLKLPGTRDELYVLAERDPGGLAGDDTRVEIRLSAPTLEGLIEGLLGEAEDLGRDLAIDQLFDDEDAGFNINGLSLGTLVTAMQLAPGVPIPRELLYALNARVQPPAPPRPLHESA